MRPLGSAGVGPTPTSTESKDNLQSVFDGSLAPSIRYISKNPWPLIVPNELGNSSLAIHKIAHAHHLPVSIVAEFVGIIQSLGFVGESQVVCSDESGAYFGDPQKGIDKVRALQAKNESLSPENITAIDHFFAFLSALPCIRKYMQLGAKAPKLPHGWFHIASLYDMPFARFTSLTDFLDFLRINLSAQSHMFGDNHLQMLVESSSIPLDDLSEDDTRDLSADFVAGRETTRLPELCTQTLGMIEVNGQEIPIKIRLAPCVAPIGFGYILSLDLANESGVPSDQNYCYYIGFSFEKDRTLSRIQSDPVIRPVVHTIQSSYHNIGYDADGKLRFVKEPITTEMVEQGFHILEQESRDTPADMKRKKDYKRMIKGKLEKWFGGLDMESELLGLLGDKFFGMGFTSFDVINGNENLWLMNHNTGKDAASVEKSAQSRYEDKLRVYRPEKLANGRSRIHFTAIAKHFAKNPERAALFNELHGYISSIESMVSGANTEVSAQKIVHLVRGNIENALKTKEKFDTRDEAINRVNTTWEQFFAETGSGGVGSITDTLEAFPNFAKIIIGIMEDQKKSNHATVASRPRRSRIKDKVNRILEETQDGFGANLRILEQVDDASGKRTLRDMLQELSRF